MISLKNVSKLYGKTSVLKNINLTIIENESIAFLGANGSGKTTLVEIISGVLKPTTGHVEFANEFNEHIKKKIGVQFQEGYWPSGTNLLNLIKFYKGRKYVNSIEGQEMLNAFELTDILKKNISALSGGQRQRLNCFLSILNNPDILILDELITGLDLKMQLKLTTFFKEWKETHELNLLIVSHNPEEVELLCERIILLKEGTIYLDAQTKNIIKKYGSIRKLLSDYFKEG